MEIYVSVRFVELHENCESNLGKSGMRETWSKSLLHEREVFAVEIASHTPCNTRECNALATLALASNTHPQRTKRKEHGFQHTLHTCRRNGGRIYYRETTDPTLLQRAADDVDLKMGIGYPFMPTALHISTWYRVTHYGAYSSTPVKLFSKSRFVKTDPKNLKHALSGVSMQHPVQRLQL